MLHGRVAKIVGGVSWLAVSWASAPKRVGTADSEWTFDRPAIYIPAMNPGPERAVAVGGSVRASGSAKSALPEISMPSIVLGMMLGIVMS
jgi:hypothetical protein